MKTELESGVEKYLRGKSLEFTDFEPGDWHNPELIFRIFNGTPNLIIEKNNRALRHYGALDLLVSHVYYLRLDDKSEMM